MTFFLGLFHPKKTNAGACHYSSPPICFSPGQVGFTIESCRLCNIAERIIIIVELFDYISGHVMSM